MDITKIFSETHQTTPVDFNVNQDFYMYFRLDHISAATGIDLAELQKMIDTHQIDTDLDQEDRLIIHEREYNRLVGLVDDDRLKAFNRFIRDVDQKCTSTHLNAIQQYFQTLEAQK